MVLNGLWADWTWNPVWDFLFARSYGPLFPAVHASSVLAVCLTAFCLACRVRSLSKGVVLSFTVATFRDYSCAFGYVILYGMMPTRSDIGELGWFYFAADLAILILALTVANRDQIKRIGASVAVAASYYLAIYLVGLNGSTLINGVGPSPLFYSPAQNAIEVFGWILPCIPWWVP